ncbi:MAG: hypothetical protein JNL08_03965 [Planctomycetes bacterium]|nr:hypothetical protein [Planctomycetota bacterium]
MDALPADAARWSLPRRLAFRFVFVYLLLYSLPWPLGWIPGTGVVAQWYESGSDALLAWFGHSVLGVTADLAPFPTGSGDTTRAYVALVLQPVLAVLVTLSWSAFDRRAAHPRLADLLRTWLRYVLASAMLGYGCAKFFGGQFPALDVSRLQATWGECSPMGVVWRFMGASQAYTAFSGVVECFGGLLLLWRRTATLGALVSAGAMTNVVLINFCYDVPVKLYSSHLLLMAVAIAWRDLPRLAALFVWNRAVPAAALRLPAPRWAFWTARVAKVAVVGFLLFGNGMGVVGRASAPAETGPIDGHYDVVALQRDGQDVPTPAAEARAWRRFSCRYGQVTLERHGSKEREYYRVQIDAAAQTATLQRLLPPDADVPPDLVLKWRDPAAPPAAAQPVEAAATAAANAVPANASAKAPKPGRVLELEGEEDGHRFVVRLHEPPLASFPLYSRGFHWIQEYPYHR